MRKRRDGFRALLGPGWAGDRRAYALAGGRSPRGYTISPTQDAAGRAEMWLYGIIDHEEWWGDEITPAYVVTALQAIGDADVLIHLDSPGGDVFAGINIYNTIKAHMGNVEVKIDGLAASAASVVMLAGNTVTIEPEAWVMIHDAWGVAVGPEDEVRDFADLLGRTSQNMANMYGRRTGETPDAMRALMKRETWYVGQEAIDAKLADQLGTTGPAGGTGEEMAARWNLGVYACAPDVLCSRPGSPQDPRPRPRPAVVPGPNRDDSGVSPELAALFAAPKKTAPEFDIAALQTAMKGLVVKP